MSGHTYTTSEKARRTRLLAKGAKGAYGDTTAIERELDRLERTAADRYEREQRALARQVDQAKDELAAAKAAERAADRSERQRAKQARKDAEQRLRRAERAYR
ncbi:hypothetical protein AN217_17260 [Streptomyces qinglanensis]|uniref:Uncharacterized protein n=1 Tax=Streptomyces qinglanensis TaxID=943816 RepID=A0A1E7K5T7_9ACTN|nr:hypothetical protein [Streptomyces qinglanensis]OEU99269.1 hypothetical protein AN217_17260 [Streptomyces qinglanensis]OEV28361.1 hypothetical protein AN220_01890 [Streptomyces nanshensis]